MSTDNIISIYKECVQNNISLIKDNNFYVPITARYTIDSVLQTFRKINQALEFKCNLQLVDMTTNEAIEYYSQRKFKCCALNFANAQHCGGSYISGERGSQEEELMRCAPALYTSLNAVCYPFNNYKEVLYTEKVEFLKHYDKDKKQYLYKFDNLKGDFIPTATIISAAAPDLRNSFQKFETQKMLALLRAICYLPLTIQNQERADTLILGAIGSGVFQNDPNTVASLFLQVIAEVKPYYKNIIFAIPNEKSANYIAYQKILQIQ